MFVHLHLHSPYSFLDGASDIETLVRRAAGFGMPALALTDHNSLAAAVKFTYMCQGYGIKPILGAEVTLEDRSHLTLLARSRAGYANLCRLLSLAYASGGRLTPHLPWEALESGVDDLICLTGCSKGRVASLTRAHRYDEAEATAVRLRELFGRERLFVELQDDFTPDSARVCRDLHALSRHLGVGAVVTNNVHYATRRDFIAHDVLRCIGAGITVADVHESRPLNFERFLKSEARMAELFSWCPDALVNTVRIAEQCGIALPQGEQITPRYLCPEGRDAAGYLRYLAYKGAKARYKELDAEIEARLDHELSVITELGYADYFLMAWKVVRWSRATGIRCTGRGSAADSCVAYALLLTDVDVIARKLPFARFLTPGKTPDIDLDFDASKRDDVFRYIQSEYGEANVAMACMFFTYHARGALRDVGKVLGLPPDVLKFFSKNVAHFVRANKISEAFESNPELKPHANVAERFQLLFDVCKRIASFPRHIGTHSSGVVISRVPLDTIAPVQPTARGLVNLMTLDKDDVEEVGAIKLDVLSLRILSAVEDATADIRRHTPEFRYGRIPREDPDTYAMIQSGRALGAFQLESPAQMALASVLEPNQFEDLVASVALIRPGPIRGNVVKRFVACRNGWSRADVLHPCLAPFLEKTYGCIVFQEQVVQVIAAMTGLSEADADRFRKRLAYHDKMETMEEAREAFIEKACSRHPELTLNRALVIWQQIEGWSGYGFTEGHAASFAITAQKSAYLSVHHPAEYFAAMMSSQPMGYYSSNTLAAEARRRGVQILGVDINLSEDKCRAEDDSGLRLGLRVVEGMREEDVETLLTERGKRPFVSLLDFCARVPLHRDCLENLVLAGAFDKLHDHRRGILWRLDETVGLAMSYRAEASSRTQTSLALGTAATLATPCAWEIEDFTPYEKFQWEWRITGVAANCHPFAYVRETLSRFRILTTYEASRQKPHTRVTVAGLNLRPHRPPTRAGRTVLFTTIEDETDYLQATCVGEALAAYTPVFLLSPMVIVRGTIERKGAGAFIMVEKAKPLRMQDYRSEEGRVSADESGADRSGQESPSPARAA